MRRHHTIALTLGLMTLGAPIKAEAVTWLHHTLNSTGEWSGGDPIGGQSSFFQAVNVDTASPSHFIQSYGLPVRVNMSFDDDVIDNAYPSSDFIQQKFMFSYNPNTAPGVDVSTHDFRATLSEQFVFSTLGCGLLSAGRAEQLTPYTTLVVEQGTYAAGVFTPTGVVLDLLNQTSTTVGAGTYRYSAVFDSGYFSANTGFAYSNNSGMFFTNEAVPEPASICAVALGLFGFARKQSKALRRRNS